MCSLSLTRKWGCLVYSLVFIDESSSDRLLPGEDFVTSWGQFLCVTDFGLKIQDNDYTDFLTSTYTQK